MNIIDTTFLNSVLSDADSRRIKLVLQLNYFGIFFHLAYSLFYAFIGFSLLYPQIINLTLFIIPYLVSIKLIHNEKYATSKIIMMYSATWPVFTGSMFFIGKEAGIHFFLLLYAIVPLIIWKIRNYAHIITLFVINISCFLLVQYVFNDRYLVMHFPNKYLLLLSASCYIISFLIIGIIVASSQIITENFESFTKEQAHNLIDTNKQLTHHTGLLQEINVILKERQRKIETQSKELEAQKENLEKINMELNDLVATKDKLFSIIAHDLKNPMSAIMGLSELLHINQSRYTEEKKSKMLSAISESSKNSYLLLENLLTWSRMQTGSIKINPEELYVYTLVKQNINLLEYMRSDKNIVLELDMDEGLLAYADGYLLSVIVNNLLSNAIKFTPREGKIVISAISEENNYIIICIEDNGVGIPPSTIPKLFKIDQNYSTHGTNGEKGTGLGLLLCKEFVERNDGKIWVESKLNIGSKFFFTVRSIPS